MRSRGGENLWKIITAGSTGLAYKAYADGKQAEKKLFVQQRQLEELNENIVKGNKTITDSISDLRNSNLSIEKKMNLCLIWWKRFLND